MLSAKFNLHTSLNEIKLESPCTERWRELLKGVGKMEADEEPLSIVTIYEILGFDDALWALRVPSLNRLSRHYQAWVVEQVLYIYEKNYPADDMLSRRIYTLRNDAAAMEERDAVRAATVAATQGTPCYSASWYVARAATDWYAKVATVDAASAIYKDTPAHLDAGAAFWAARNAQKDKLLEMIRFFPKL